MTRVATATMVKWLAMVICKAIISVENPTPTIPPVLQRPWKDPLILRSNCFWSAMACVFIEILRTRMLNAKTQSEAIRLVFVVAKPTHKSAKAKTTNAIANGIRLLYRATSQPDIGSPISELAGINKRMVPNSASL